MVAKRTASGLRVADDILSLIGMTPLLRLRHLAGGDCAALYAKLETFNPGFSLKDRAALGMIRKAEASGALQPGETIVEATAGNTGVGLALIGVQLGYKVALFVPQKFSEEKVKLMEAFGATVTRTPNAEGMLGAIRQARALSTQPKHWFASQFENPGNPEIHYETTGQELIEQMEGRIDAVVLGAGSGGTFSGVARAVKEKCPAAKAVLVETIGSIFGGGPAGSHDVEGIGNDFIPGTLDLKLADEIVQVSDHDAFAMVRRLAREEGVLAGSSAGAAVFAALNIARRLGPGARVATLVPDSAERYLSKDIFHHA